MRFDRPTVSVAQIEAVVARFYSAARQDVVLGPAFAAHVDDWARHEAKIVAFWRNALRGEFGYDGNPMRAHSEAQAVEPEHFGRWLDLFDRTLAEVLSPDAAGSWSLMAHRIGRSLRMGISDERGGIPTLRPSARSP